MTTRHIPAAPFAVPEGSWDLWIELMRSNAAEADRHYFDVLLSPHIAYLRRNGPLHAPVDVLVTLVGFSPMVSALVAALVTPRIVVAIGSREAAGSLALLEKFLAAGGTGKPVEYTQSIVDAGDSRSVFWNVHDAFRSNGGGAVDITGGKKLMTAAAAQAAWHLDRDACYLESRSYVAELRRPLPGDEELIFLPRRSSLLGEAREGKGYG